uniref:Uncharacterized protein n=1 Tax=Myotis myotis TaxID=51298 RepID=A0A7J7SCK6_MYOMY|nr:hypothetical protein mMyoMyo1_009448 [Myotis myotis]
MRGKKWGSEKGKRQGDRETADRGQGRAPTRPRCGSGPAGTGCLGCGDPTGPEKGRVQGAWGGLGLQGHRMVLIQRHRSDGMRAINYCDKMQSWPAHCRRVDRSLSPAPHWSHAQASAAGMPLPTSLSIPPHHTLPLTARVGATALGKR